MVFSEAAMGKRIIQQYFIVCARELFSLVPHLSYPNPFVEHYLPFSFFFLFMFAHFLASLHNESSSFTLLLLFYKAGLIRANGPFLFMMIFQHGIMNLFTTCSVCTFLLSFSLAYTFSLSISYQILALFFLFFVILATKRFFAIFNT